MHAKMLRNESEREAAAQHHLNIPMKLRRSVRPHGPRTGPHTSRLQMIQAPLRDPNASLDVARTRMANLWTVDCEGS